MAYWKRIPKHIGVIPDGNRRWAAAKGMEKQDGYQSGIDPGFQLYQACMDLGIEELTFYGFTKDNTKRPAKQTQAFQRACVDAVNRLAYKDADLLIVGNTESKLFPDALMPYTTRTKFGHSNIKVNFLVNYSWDWDIFHPSGLRSSDISRMDLIIRWGGHHRLSGFLPAQSVYADMYVIEDYWPDFKPEHLYDALDWYQDLDVTLGG